MHALLNHAKAEDYTEPDWSNNEMLLKKGVRSYRTKINPPNPNVGKKSTYLSYWFFFFSKEAIEQLLQLTRLQLLLEI